jgi:DeoR family glycerol-3-phosphate regulon repressor
MTVNPRQQRLLDEIRRSGALSVESLASRLEVTAQTVRRDLRLLSDQGLLARFHGGAGLPDSTTRNIAYAQRQSLNAEGKRRIAREVARRVPNGCSLILNLGTTVEEAARELRRHEGLRVVTNNPKVAALLAHEANAEVMLAGGTVRPIDHGVVGEPAVDFVRQFKVDIALIGISSIEPDGTLRDFDYREIRVAQAIITAAREVWLLADHSKFERRAMVELGHLSQVDVLITDALPPEPFEGLLREHSVRCIVADED